MHVFKEPHTFHPQLSLESFILDKSFFSFVINNQKKISLQIVSTYLVEKELNANTQIQKNKLVWRERGSHGVFCSYKKEEKNKTGLFSSFNHNGGRRLFKELETFCRRHPVYGITVYLSFPCSKYFKRVLSQFAADPPPPPHPL